MKKYFKLLAIFLLQIALLTACSSDEPDYEPDGDGWENSNSDNNSDPTAEKVKSNISASVSYGDYSWNMRITSRLASAFPGKAINYGTECGYGEYQYYSNFKFKNENIENTDDNGNMTISFPLFVGDEYPNESLYWYSYKELKYKLEHGVKLQRDELDFYNSLLGYLQKAESSAKASFCGRLYVIIDGNKYFYYSYGKTPTGSSSSSGSSASSGSSSTIYEKPELGFADYNLNTTSITVKFRIYNQDKAKVSSAKGYYGKSSASSAIAATVSGSMITMKVTGLTKGTTYYFKCSATGPGGTTTSDQVKLSTLY